MLQRVSKYVIIIHLNYIYNLFRSSHKTKPVPITKSSRITVFIELIAVYFEICPLVN